MDKEFIMATAKEAERQILWSIDKWAYMSWGIRQKAAIEYEGMATLALRVSGLRHKGWVYVSLNEGMDCYEVRLLNVARTKVKRTLEEVYCDNLGEVLDGLIEKDPTLPDDKYRDKAMRDSARKMGMEVIDSPKSDNSSTINNQNKEDNTMRLNMNQKNETKNVQITAQVMNNTNAPAVEDAVAEEVVESVAVGEATIDNIMPKMTAEPQTPTKQEVAQAISKAATEDTATTMPLGQHGTLVIGGVGKSDPTPKPAMPKRDKYGKFMKKGAAEQAQPESKEQEAGRYQYVTYDVKKVNKVTKKEYTVTGSKIVGFDLADPIYLAGPAFCGAISTETAGDKAVGVLRFSHKWTPAVKDVCDLLNSGRATLEGCVAIINGAKAERSERIKERIAKRAEREAKKQQATTQSAAAAPAAAQQGKTYTAADMEATIREAFGALAGAMKADVKQFEPLIAAAMKKAA